MKSFSCRILHVIRDGSNHGLMAGAILYWHDYCPGPSVMTISSINLHFNAKPNQHALGNVDPGSLNTELKISISTKTRTNTSVATFWVVWNIFGIISVIRGDGEIMKTSSLLIQWSETVLNGRIAELNKAITNIIIAVQIMELCGKCVRPFETINGALQK